MSAGHIDDGYRWINLSGSSGDFPAVQFSCEIDVGYDRAIWRFLFLEKRNCFLTGCCDSRFKATFCKSLFDDRLNKLVVLNDQDPITLTTVHFPLAASLQSLAGLSDGRKIGSNNNVQK
jgi:hypothetical protein